VPCTNVLRRTMLARMPLHGPEFHFRILCAFVKFVDGNRSLRAAILAYLQQFALVQFLDADELVGCFARQDQLDELGLRCLAVSVLRVLENEYHEKGDDRGARVDNELPGFGMIENRPGNDPRRYQYKSNNEAQRLPGQIRYGGRKP
jgi:hypothetical protein